MSKQELMTLKDIDKALEKHVSDAGARIEKPTGQSIGIKGKKFKYKDDVIGRVASFVIGFISLPSTDSAKHAGNSIWSS